jgi:hypothetical protein
MSSVVQSVSVPVSVGLPKTDHPIECPKRLEVFIRRAISCTNTQIRPVISLRELLAVRTTSVWRRFKPLLYSKELLSVPTRNAVGQVQFRASNILRSFVVVELRTASCQRPSGLELGNGANVANFGGGLLGAEGGGESRGVLQRK